MQITTKRDVIEMMKSLPDDAPVIITDMDGIYHHFEIAIHDEKGGYDCSSCEAEIILARVGNEADSIIKWIPINIGIDGSRQDEFYELKERYGF